MNDILEIGKVFKSLLTGIDQVNKEVKGRIFPSLAAENTPFPFIVYRRTATQFEGTKDCYSQICTASVELVVCGKTYTQSLDIASAIVGNMPCEAIGYVEGFHVSSIELTGAFEQYNDGSFEQVLSYNIELY